MALKVIFPTNTVQILEAEESINVDPQHTGLLRGTTIVGREGTGGDIYGLPSKYGELRIRTISTSSDSIPETYTLSDGTVVESLGKERK